MKRFTVIFLATAAIALAQNQVLSHPDTPSRFSGTAAFYLAGTPGCASAAFVSEDLPDPAFKNRFHVLLQFYPLPYCALPAMGGAGHVKVQAFSNGMMQISSEIFGGIEVDLIPIDDKVRQFMIDASHADNGGWENRWQTMTLRPVAANYSIYELLIEEPI